MWLAGSPSAAPRREGCHSRPSAFHVDSGAARSSYTHIVRDVEEIRRLKMLPGKDMHAVGGARLVFTLLNAGLIDELRLIVHPLVLGKGMPLFKDVKERQALTLLDVTPLQSGLLRLKYRT